MADNLGSYSGFTLSSADLQSLDSAPQVWCSIDPTFYECAPDPSTTFPSSTSAATHNDDHDNH